MNRADVETLGTARRDLGMSVLDLWVDYVSLGGNLAPVSLEALLREGDRIEDHDFDLIVHALNERYSERNQNHPLAYADELPPSAH